jgi:Protein of unknown function (DUF3054)
VTAERRTIILSATADVVAVLVFVALGRRSHDEPGNAVAGALRVAAPFLIGLAVGWLVARAWRRPTSMTTGLVVWPVTVAVGMLLRRTIFDRGTALSFVIVASIATGVLLLGWRALAALAARRRQG